MNDSNQKACYRFGNTSVTGTTAAETCKRVLTCDENSFIPGWRQSTVEVIGEKSFIVRIFLGSERGSRLFY